jgi:hypothetical protein
MDSSEFIVRGFLWVTQKEESRRLELAENLKVIVDTRKQAASRGATLRSSFPAACFQGSAWSRTLAFL